MRLALAAALWLIAGSESAAPLPRYGVFVFSSLCEHADGGDISGSRMVLVRSRGWDQMLFDYGSGGLMGATVDRLSIDGDQLEAELSPGEGGKAHLRATLSAERAVIHFKFDDATSEEGSAWPLTRITDLGRPLETCR